MRPLGVVPGASNKFCWMCCAKVCAVESASKRRRIVGGTVAPATRCASNTPRASVRHKPDFLASRVSSFQSRLGDEASSCATSQIQISRDHACSDPTTLAKVTEGMQRSFDPAVNEELAEEAIQQLHDKKLVKTWGASSKATRREFIGTLSAVALPLVVSLSVADQRAYAQRAVSARPTPTPVGGPPPPPPPPPPPVPVPKPHS